MPLPETWAVATIDHITAYVQRGKSPAYAEKSDLPVVNQKCVRWNGVDTQWLKYIHPAQWPQWGEERFLRVGDVLWNSTGTGTIGRAALFRGLPGYERAVADSHVTILRTRHYLPGFLHYWIMSPSVQTKIDRMQAGSTNQVELSRTEVLATEVVVPPLPEQQRIVEAIESYLTRLDNAVALLERAEQNLKRYRASVLKAAVEGRLVPTEAELAQREGRSYEPASELLKRILAERKTRWIEDAAEKARAKAEEKARKAGQPWTAKDNVATLEKERAKAAKQYKEPAAPDTTDLPDLPEGWCWASADQLVSYVTSGSRGWAQHYSDAGATFIRIGNLRRGRLALDLSDVQRVKLPRGAEGTRTRLEAGDVLISITADLGIVGVVAEGIGEAYVNQHIALARPLSLLHASYLGWYLTSTVGQAELKLLRRGATKPGLGLDDIRAARVALPPSPEQQRIVSALTVALDAAEHQSDNLSRLGRKGTTLRQSVLKWAFEGKLVEQDPDDEPASVLLERINAERAAAGAPKARGGKKRSGK